MSAISLEDLQRRENKKNDAIVAGICIGIFILTQIFIIVYKLQTY